MLSVDAAFDRLDSALRQMGYTAVKGESPSDPSADRLAAYKRRNMSVRVAWSDKGGACCRSRSKPTASG